MFICALSASGTPIPLYRAVHGEARHIPLKCTHCITVKQTPALLTRTSRWPYLAKISLFAASMLSLLVMSSCMNLGRSPSSCSNVNASLPLFSLRAVEGKHGGATYFNDHDFWVIYADLQVSHHHQRSSRVAWQFQTQFLCYHQWPVNTIICISTKLCSSILAY